MKMKIKTKIFFVVAAVILLVVTYAILISRSAPQHLLFISSGSGYCYWLNGTNSSLIFPVVLLTNTSQPISVTLKDGMLFANGAELTNTVNEFISKHIAGFIEKPFVFGNLSVAPEGMQGNLTLLLNTGTAVGAGDQVTTVYSRANNWTIYTNGTDFYIENGTLEMYDFFFSNYSFASNVIPAGLQLNNTAVSQNSSVFPQSFLPYLDSIVSNSGLDFVKGGVWWYMGYCKVTFVPAALPSGYVKWK